MSGNSHTAKKPRKAAGVRQRQVESGHTTRVRGDESKINSPNGNKSTTGRVHSPASLEEMSQADQLLYRAWAKTYKNRRPGRKAI